MHKVKLPVFILSSLISTSVYRKTIKGIEDEVVRNRLEIQPLNSLSSLRTSDEIADVVIVINFNSEFISEIIEHLDEFGKKAILAGIDPVEYGVNTSGVAVNRESSMKKMLSYMTSCGKSNISFLGFQPTSTSDIIRKNVFLKSGFPPENIYTNDVSIDFCIDSFINDYRKKNIDAVICANDAVSFLFALRAESLGISVPSDILVSGFGNMLISRISNPRITSCTVSYYETGVQSVYAWLFLAKHPDVSAIKLTINDKLIFRESTGIYNKNIRLPYCAEYLNPPEPNAPGSLNSSRYSEIILLENCLLRCNRLDLRIIDGIMMNKSYESIAENEYTSISTVNYRASKLFNMLNVADKKSFIALFGKYIQFEISKILDTDTLYE